MSHDDEEEHRVLPQRLGPVAVARVTDAAGAVAAVALSAGARVRRRRPLHPRGSTYLAVLVRHGLVENSGVPWLDDRGEAAAVVRLSRAVGLPRALPGVLGLAVRVGLEQGPVDLLLASSGSGLVTRALLVPTWGGAATGYGSLMTYGTPLGRVRLLAVAESDAGPGAEIVLAAAFGSGPFEPYARLRLGSELSVDGDDPRRAFDAVRHPPPGLRADGFMARFRAPAYASVREAREGQLSWPVPHTLVASAGGGEVPDPVRLGTEGV